MKEVAKYNGKIIKLAVAPMASTVRLTEVGTGNSVETGAVTETLTNAGLNDGDEFEVIVQQSDDGNLSGVIRRKGSTVETDFGI